ncbi:MAG: hypothetical protein R3C59_03255 [Planctomycetaceae bacterium]
MPSVETEVEFSRARSSSEPLDDRQHRKTRYRRLLTGLLAAAVAVPLLVLLAEVHVRWMTAIGMQHLYDLIDPPLDVDSGPPARRGLDPERIKHALTSQNGGQWQVIADSTDISSDFADFAHEDPQHSSTIAFRKDTADLVPEEFDVFEIARSVRALTNRRTDFTGHNVRDVLEAARARRGLQCHHFVRLFGSVCSSRGYTTRMVLLSALGQDFDHAACEVFLPESARWILIDVDFGIAYRSRGVWLNAYELQQIWKAVRDDVPTGQRMAGISTESARRKNRIKTEHSLEMVKFGQTESELRRERLAASPTGCNLELFEYIFLATRDDYLSRSYPVAHPFRIGQICFRADGLESLIETCPEAHFVPVETAYASIGRSTVEVVRVNPGPDLKLRFASSMPRFQGFEVRRNHGEWQAVKTPDDFHWTLYAGANVLEVRAVNMIGVSGPPAGISIRQVQPAQGLVTIPASVLALIVHLKTLLQ